MKKDVICMYSEKCLRCKHLTDLPEEVKNFKKCHYTSGNSHCPAQYIFLTKGVNLDTICSKLKSARQDGNTKRMGVLLEKISKLHPTVQEQLMKQSQED